MLLTAPATTTPATVAIVAMVSRTRVNAVGSFAASSAASAANARRMVWEPARGAEFHRLARCPRAAPIAVARDSCATDATAAGRHAAVVAVVVAYPLVDVVVAAARRLCPSARALRANIVRGLSPPCGRRVRRT